MNNPFQPKNRFSVYICSLEKIIEEFFAPFLLHNVQQKSKNFDIICLTI